MRRVLRRMIYRQRCRNDRGLALDAREILVLVLVNLQRRQELRVVILHRKAEMWPVIVPQHLRVIAAGCFGRARGARSAVVVCGYRERPIAQRIVVVAQQLRRGLGFEGRIEAVVMAAANRHVMLAGGTGELPNAKRAGAGTRAALEA